MRSVRVLKMVGILVALVFIFTGCLLVEDGPQVPSNPSLVGEVRPSIARFAFEKEIEDGQVVIKRKYAKLLGGEAYVLSWAQFEQEEIATVVSPLIKDQMEKADFDLDEAFVLIMNIRGQSKKIEEPVDMTFLLIMASIQRDKEQKLGKEFIKMRGIGGVFADSEYDRLSFSDTPAGPNCQQVLVAESVVAPWISLNGKGYILYEGGYPKAMTFNGILRGAYPGSFFFNVPIKFRAIPPMCD